MKILNGITMMNMTPDNYRPNVCKAVYKFNREGKIVHTYDSMTDAVKGEHIAHGKLKELISSKNMLRGHYFSRTPDEKAVSSSHSLQEEGLELWETENGMFDINGWGKVCL